MSEPSLSTSSAPTHPEHSGSQRASVAQVLGAAVLFGTTGTSAHFAPASAGPVAIGSARLIVGGASLLAALPLLGGSRRHAVSLWRTRWGLASGLTTALYQLAFFAGVQRAGVALATLVTIGSGPIIVGLLGWLLLRERPSLTWWISTAICIAGLVLLTFDGAERPGVDVGGLLLSLTAAFGYAVYTVGSRRLMLAGHQSSEVMAAALGLGGLILVPVLLATGFAWLASVNGLAIVLWLGLGATTLAYMLFGLALRVLPAGPVATLVLAEPLVATLLGVGLLGERLGWVGWAGAALVAAGLALEGVMTIRSRATSTGATEVTEAAETAEASA